MRHVYIGATPEVGREDSGVVRQRMAREFPGATKELELPGVDFAYNAERQQYGSIAVLEMVLRVCPDDAWKMVAVTDRDLYVPVLTFVFGQAQLGGRAAVISLARLRQEFYGLPPNREVFEERVSKEALHEAGHLFGLVHCADRRCAMSLATNVRQIDEKSAWYCANCAALLKREAGE